MEYGLMVTAEQEKVLEEAGIEYNYWDMEGMLLGAYEDQEKVDIVFDSDKERDQALLLIKSKS